ncbi:hypothetical protein P2318_00095 [Myxococcaceae bacterium GXIMD 01537]
MARRAVALAGGALFLLVGTGCPEDHRKGGTFDRAASKDLRQRFSRDEKVELEEEEQPDCAEGQVAQLRCDPAPCEWICK